VKYREHLRLRREAATRAEALALASKHLDLLLATIFRSCRMPVADVRWETLPERARDQQAAQRKGLKMAKKSDKGSKSTVAKQTSKGASGGKKTKPTKKSK
jgi:hypothetical protein